MHLTRVKKQGLIAPSLIIIGTMLIIILASNREYLTYGTETDFLGGFLPEAQRIIDGESLSLSFHPPFYSFILAIAYSAFTDWFLAGRIISVISGILVLGSSYLLFNRLGNQYMGVGAVLALTISPLFLTYSALATSDMFFLALYMVSFLFVFAASQKQSPTIFLWIVSGLLVGVTILTRTNGIVIALLITFALFQDNVFKTRIKSFLLATGSLCFILFAWVLVATWTNSPIWPTDNSANLAMTYFSPTEDRVSGDTRRLMEEQFDGIIDVIAYDPLHILKVYILDLLRLGRRIFSRSEIMLVPLGIIGLLGIFTYAVENKQQWVKNRQRFVMFLLLVTLLHLLLTNFKGYEARFYLFLIPVFGAFAGGFYQFLLARISRITPVVLGVALIPLFVIAVNSSTREVSGHLMNHELSDAVPKALAVIEPPCTIFARKSHLAFYASCQAENLPNASDLEALKIVLTRESPQPTYLFYGGTERLMRPQLSQLRNAENSPSWLEPVATSDVPGWWVLYKIHPSCTSVSCD